MFQLCVALIMAWSYGGMCSFFYSFVSCFPLPLLLHAELACGAALFTGLVLIINWE